VSLVELDGWMTVVSEFARLSWVSIDFGGEHCSEAGGFGMDSMPMLQGWVAGLTSGRKTYSEAEGRRSNLEVDLENNDASR
jgi:hypothetical protein